MRAFPFDSQIVGQDENGMPLYDRASSADEFARLLSSFFRDGVFGEGMCQVLASGGSSVTVGGGEMLIQGRYGFMTGPQTIDLGAAHATLPRIDTIVARRDLTAAVNYIVLDVVKGTPASTPVAPVFTRDGTIWELGFANVLRPAGVSEVTQDNISDTRLSSERCGIVQAVLSKVDSENLFVEFETLLNDMRANLQQMYEELPKTNLISYYDNLLVDEWSLTSQNTYTITRTVSGILSSDEPFYDANMTGVTDMNDLREIRDAFDCLIKIEPTANTLTYYATRVPMRDLPIKIKVVR